MKTNNIDVYVDKLSELHPDIPKPYIRQAISFGWRSLVKTVKMGIDVHLTDNGGLYFHVGTIHTNPSLFVKNYIITLYRKIRVLNYRLKVPWDGYYYFSIHERRYEQNIKPHLEKKGRGGRKKVFNYGQVTLYKYKDACIVAKCYNKYVYKIPYNIDLGYSVKVAELQTDKAILDVVRRNVGFKSILVSNYPYKALEYVKQIK